MLKGYWPFICAAYLSVTSLESLAILQCKQARRLL